MRIFISTNETLSKDSVTEDIPLPSSIKSWLKLISPTEQRLFVTKQRGRKKFYCLLPLITRPHRILKLRFSWNTGISFNSNLDLHVSLTSHRLYLTGRKKSLKDVLVREKLPSTTPQSLTVVNKEAHLKSLFSSQKEIYVWSSASNTLSLRSRISYSHSTEQTKLAISFSLWTFLLIIYSDRRSWGLVD